MYIKIKKKKIEIIELNSFWERFKGLKFILEPIDYGVKFPNKKLVSTYFLCQKVDVVLTDKDEEILYFYESVNSEKYILPKPKVNNVYFLPLGTVKLLEIGEKLELIGDNKKKKTSS